MAAPLKDSAAGFYNFITNRWIASVIPAAIGVWLASTGKLAGYLGLFRRSQSIDCLDCADDRCRLRGQENEIFICQHRGRPGLAAVDYRNRRLSSGSSSMSRSVPLPRSPGPGWTVMVLLVVMFILNFVFIFDFIKSKSYKVE